MTNPQMGWACPGWRGDLAACLVGALDPQPSARVRRHLGTCPACQAEYEDLAMVVARLALFTRAAPVPYDTLCDGISLPGRSAGRPTQWRRE